MMTSHSWSGAEEDAIVRTVLSRSLGVNDREIEAVKRGAYEVTTNKFVARGRASIEREATQVKLIGPRLAGGFSSSCDY